MLSKIYALEWTNYVCTVCLLHAIKGDECCLMLVCVLSELDQESSLLLQETKTNFLLKNS